MNMKNIFNKGCLLFVAITAVALSSCVDPVDLVTENAKEGGLVNPVSGNIPYIVGVDQVSEVGIVIPTGPGVQSIEVWNTFQTVDGLTSNSVLMSTIDVSSGNTGDDVEEAFNVDYSDLSEGITLEGAPLPASDTELSVGDFWTLNFTSIMPDGRKVLNNAQTTIGIANPYAGVYSRVGLLIHPTAGNLPYDETGLELITVDGSTVKTLVGYWENPAYILTIKVNADFSCTIGGIVGTNEVTAQPGKVNVYDPATKTFTLNYTYNSRLFSEVMTLEE